MKITNKIWWFLIIGALSIFLCNFIKQEALSTLLDKLIFSTVSAFVGIVIAVVGVFLGSINALYLTLHKMIKSRENYFSDSEIQKIKNGLADLVEELRQNALFSIYAFLLVVFLFFAKEIDIPYLKWFIDTSICSKISFINFIILYLTFLIFWAIIDSTKVIFKVTNAFELVKEE